MFQRMAVALLALVPLCLGDNKYSKTNTQTWDFVPAGQVELRVRYGDVHILPAEDSQLSISYRMHSSHSDFIGKVEPRFEVKGSKAVLTLKAPRNGSTEVNLKVAARTDIYLRVSAGDITLGPIEGNKDLETHAGDIDVEIVGEASYGPVDASTHAGDVASPFGKAHGWIGHSLKYQGTGEYRIHAHTFAGDVTFHEPEAPGTTQTAPGPDDFESSLRRILNLYVADTKARMLNKLPSLYAEDALYIGASGKVEGRVAIPESLASEFAEAPEMKLGFHSIGPRSLG